SSPLFTQLDAASAAIIFTAFAVLATHEWRLNKLAAAAFVLHGFSQWIWRSLWFTPLAQTHDAILLGFPLSRFALLFGLTTLISATPKRAQAPHQKVVRDIDLLELPDPTVTRLVMISSTVADLLAERDAAERAIKNLGLTRFRAETFPSLPHTPREVCAAM